MAQPSQADRANGEFVIHAPRPVAAQGVSQFGDAGTQVPRPLIAVRVDLAARVAYVDNERRPRHARRRRTASTSSTYVTGG